MSVLLIDVREPEEFAEAHLPEAISVPLATLAEAISTGKIARDRPIVAICAHGSRAARAVEFLTAHGYSAVSADVHMAAREDATVIDDRYSRQQRLPGVGLRGQQILSDARVLLVGVGGLGSPVATYLAGAGVGTLTLVDPDRVEPSNLPRQIVHDTASLGQYKVASAARRLAALNPDVKIVTRAEALTTANSAELVAGQTLVIDGSDTFAARYAINDACILHRVPWLHASVHRMSGQITAFVPDSPCYRCLFPAPPEGVLGANCAEAGVLGPVVGVLGTLLATEALKHLLGLGANLPGTLLTYDALAADFTRFQFDKRVSCTSCGLATP